MPDDLEKDQAGFRRDSANSGDKNRPENKQEKLDEKLDEALEETFPSSDPVSVKITK
jgi:fructose-1,6-bisphosphatase